MLRGVRLTILAKQNGTRFENKTPREIIPLFVHQCHEKEILEVFPIEGIPFLNQIKSTQLNTTQIKSNKSNVGF